MVTYLVLDSPPFSVNKAYYKRTFTRTKECRKWADNIHRQLLEDGNLHGIREFKRAFDPDKECVHLIIHFYYPTEILYTKKGGISRRSSDLSNIEKLLIDLIFDKRFQNRELGNKLIETLEIDDAKITKLTSEKKVSSDGKYKIVVCISSAAND